MTKQEKIQEEWLKLGINPSRATENGYIDFEILPNDFSLIECEAIYNGCIRPKSLHGIETNNGWIKIESEADLPTKGIYHVIKNFDENVSELEFPHPSFTLEFNKTWWLKYVTHYQLIVKPEPPIY